MIPFSRQYDGHGILKARGADSEDAAAGRFVVQQPADLQEVAVIKSVKENNVVGPGIPIKTFGQFSVGARRDEADR